MLRHFVSGWGHHIKTEPMLNLRDSSSLVNRQLKPNDGVGEGVKIDEAQVCLQGSTAGVCHNGGCVA